MGDSEIESDTDIDSQNPLIEVSLPTAKYPDDGFRVRIFRAFVYIPSPRSVRQGTMGIDDRMDDSLCPDGFFGAADQWPGSFQTSHAKQGEDGGMYVNEALSLVDAVAIELDRITDDVKRREERNRLAKEIGWLQGGAEDMIDVPEISGKRSEPARQILAKWQTAPPWEFFNEKRKEGVEDWRRKAREEAGNEAHMPKLKGFGAVRGKDAPPHRGPPSRVTSLSDTFASDPTAEPSYTGGASQDSGGENVPSLPSGTSSACPEDSVSSLGR